MGEVATKTVFQTAKLDYYAIKNDFVLFINFISFYF